MMMPRHRRQPDAAAAATKLLAGALAQIGIDRVSFVAFIVL
jgi:hypothetical protein